MKAPIREIFSSIQGEGPYVGEPQAFVRFHGCNLSCAFCDVSDFAKAEEMTPEEILERIKSFGYSPKTIALTGGEPLTFGDFLLEALPVFRKAEYSIYLETNGTLPAQLSRLINLIDRIAMDFKLPSATEGDALWTDHEHFLRIARRRNVFVKIIVTDKTKKEDIEKSIEIIDRVDRDIPLIIQPVTPARRVKYRPGPKALLDFQDMARAKLRDVRIIPPIQHVLGMD